MDWRALPILDRLIGRWLTEDEKVIAEFMLCGKPEATRKLAVGSASITVGLLLLSSGTPWLTWLAPVLIVTSAYLMLPLLGGSWPGTQPVQNFGVNVPAYAFFPVGYNQFRSVFIKYNLIRCLSALPLAAAAGLAFAFFSGTELAVAAWMPIKGILLVAAAQPILFIFCVSSVTNDTRHFRLRSIVLVLATLSAFGLGVGGVAVPSLWVFAGCAVGLSLLGMVTNAYYRRHYNRMRFDLIVSSQ